MSSNNIQQEVKEVLSAAEWVLENTSFGVVAKDSPLDLETYECRVRRKELVQILEEYASQFPPSPDVSPEKKDLGSGLNQDKASSVASHTDEPVTPIKDIVLAEYGKGNIVFSDFDGLKTIPLKDFVKQPAEGILYDLNRSEVVVLTFINDPKWVNDFAVAKVITELKRQVDEMLNHGDNPERNASPPYNLAQAMAVAEEIDAKKYFLNQCAESSEAGTSGGWICVEDRLPEEGQKVDLWLVATDEEKSVRISWTWENGDEARKINSCIVSHWMPLPEPPRMGNVQVSDTTGDAMKDQKPETKETIFGSFLLNDVPTNTPEASPEVEEQVEDFLWTKADEMSCYIVEKQKTMLSIIPENFTIQVEDDAIMGWRQWLITAFNEVITRTLSSKDNEIRELKRINQQLNSDNQ